MLLDELTKTILKHLVIFIDRLDEFEGRSDQILSFVSDVCRRGSINICVAGRQWIEFSDSDVLARCSRLHVQNITRRDIFLFIRGISCGNRGFSGLNLAFPLEIEAWFSI